MQLLILGFEGFGGLHGHSLPWWGGGYWGTRRLLLCFLWFNLELDLPFSLHAYLHFSLFSFSCKTVGRGVSRGSVGEWQPATWQLAVPSWVVALCIRAWCICVGYATVLSQIAWLHSCLVSHGGCRGLKDHPLPTLSHGKSDLVVVADQGPTPYIFVIPYISYQNGQIRYNKDGNEQ
jgi:hypothetical protein